MTGARTIREATLPADIPGLRQRGVPMKLRPDASDATVRRLLTAESKWGVRGLVYIFDDEAHPGCGIVAHEGGAYDAVPLSDLAVDLTDPAGAWRAALWADPQGVPDVHDVDGITWERILRWARAGTLRPIDVIVLRDGCLRLAGRTP